MLYRNKFGINFHNNPLKKEDALLLRKNELESAWYDLEARGYFEQLQKSGELISMDRDFEMWFADFYDHPVGSYPYDRDSIFIRAFPRNRPLAMLELGFGNGCLSRFFLRRGIDVVSIELSREYCRFLKQSDPASRPLRACSEILPFKDNSFDVVTTYVALHHFNLRMALREMHRVMRPGGMGIFIEPLSNSEFLYKIRQLLPLADNESPGGGGLIRAELANELERVGFEYKIREFELLTRLERLPMLARFQKGLRKIDHQILSKLPSLRKFARTIILEIRKK